MAKKYNPNMGYLHTIPTMITDPVSVNPPVAPNGLSAVMDFSNLKTTGNRPYNPDYISYINKALIRGGVNDLQRVSMLANIVEESGGDPFITGLGGFYGLIQWSPDRYAKTGETDPYKEIDNQVEALLATKDNLKDQKSWNKGKDTGYSTLKQAYADYNSNDLSKVMRGYTLGHVRPAGGIKSYNNRLKVAKQLYALPGFRTFDNGGKLQALAQKIVNGSDSIKKIALRAFEALPSSIRKRAVEIGLRSVRNGTPSDAVREYFGSASRGVASPVKDLKYILLGSGTPSINTNDGLDHRNNGFPTTKYDKIDNDIIDAVALGKPLNPAIGRKVESEDYGIEDSYIRKYYPGRKIQYVETEPPGVDYDQTGIRSTGILGSSGSFRTSIPGVGIDNAGIVLEQGTRNDSTFVRGWDVYDFNTAGKNNYSSRWAYQEDPEKIDSIIKKADDTITPLVIRTPWVHESDYDKIFLKNGGKIHIKPEIFNGKVYYRDGGILEGDFDVDDISDEELYELDRLGYNVDIL